MEPFGFAGYAKMHRRTLTCGPRVSPGQTHVRCAGPWALGGLSCVQGMEKLAGCMHVAVTPLARRLQEVLPGQAHARWARGGVALVPSWCAGHAHGTRACGPRAPPGRRTSVGGGPARGASKVCGLVRAQGMVVFPDLPCPVHEQYRTAWPLVWAFNLERVGGRLRLAAADACRVGGDLHRGASKLCGLVRVQGMAMPTQWSTNKTAQHGLSCGAGAPL